LNKKKNTRTSVPQTNGEVLSVKHTISLRKVKYEFDSRSHGRAPEVQIEGKESSKCRLEKKKFTPVVSRFFLHLQWGFDRQEPTPMTTMKAMR
jgi:hypothetical protein